MTSSDNKLYVGNLGDNTSKKELEDIFFKYGPITNIWVARNPPGFAFVEYEDPRDAKDAIRALDGTRCCGTKLIVELSNGGRTRREGGGSAARRKQSPPIRRSRSRSPWKKTSRSRSRSRSKSFPGRRSRSFSRDRSTAKKDDNGDSGRYREWDLSCKVYVGNLLNNASKNELEDVFSKYGPIRNVWVARNPPGFAFIEFDDPRDAEDAVRGLDGMRCCGTRIIVEMSNGKTRRGHMKRSPPGSRRSRSRSPWKRNSRARSRSLRSRSRSRSPLPRKDRSRSFSRERRRYLKKDPEDCEESYK